MESKDIFDTGIGLDEGSKGEKDTKDKSQSLASWIEIPCTEERSPRGGEFCVEGSCGIKEFPSGHVQFDTWVIQPRGRHSVDSWMHDPGV